MITSEQAQEIERLIDGNEEEGKIVSFIKRSLMENSFADRLTIREKKILSKVYGRLWIEGVYDPSNAETQKVCKPLSDLMSEANETLKFKP